jgi:GT2 family glycosyltransferase
VHVAVVIPNYNSADLVSRCAASMLAQSLPGHRLDVLVVDDGSTDGSPDRLAASFGERITLIRQATNLGRSSARNAGAAATHAEVLVFVDSDCIPTDDGFIAAHLRALHAADTSFGAVLTPGNGFWDRIQRDSIAGRLQRFDGGDTSAFTTQNVAVRAEAFARAGGFDPLFDRHGFEDRDLFLRLSATGARAVYCAEAAVRHEDVITLANDSRKLGEAGRHAAAQFAARHPGAYAAMPFSRFDVALHPAMRWVDLFTAPLVRRLARGPARWLEWRWIPFRLRALAARAVYACSYLRGTVEAAAASKR